ncbi:flagellar filament capping protein FliD [Luedemannella flava]|uniref:Flagellar hook-associated protein 2 n=1 Tax=Luedemannella flava TaxID=349316 RepID=A0ABN2MEP8_9ACTN
MTSSVDGLISGLSTSALISQLMQVEAAPQTQLKTKVSNEQKVVAAYQSINTKLAALQKAAEDLSAKTTWSSVKATSSSDAVTASAANGAVTGNATFNVTSLARGQVSTAVVAGTGSVVAGGSLTVTIGSGDPVTIDVSADPSAAGVAKAINAKGLDLKAAVITTSTGDTVLQLTSTKTGTANAFTVTGLDAPVKNAVTAVDARVEVGDPATGGYAVTSSSNTFTNLMSGVTLTVKRVENDVTVDVSADADAIAAKTQAFVDAANNALKEISKQSAWSQGGTTNGPLVGDYMVRELTDRVLGTVSSGLAGYGSFKQVGVQLDRDGNLKFDKDAFAKAYAADPAAAERGAAGLGAAMTTMAETAQKNVTSSTQSRNKLVDNLNDQIAAWDVRLTARQTALQKQFSNLEVALGKLQSQSSWLSGQLAGLSSGS